MPVRSLALVPLLALACGFAAEAPVLDKKEVTLKGRTDEDVQARELWYRKHDGKDWGAWQKHGLSFGREAPIVWTVPEGRWQTYVQIVEVNGNSMPVPAQQQQTNLFTEFTIDRSAPTVAVGFPSPQAKLRGGQKYTVKWTVSDANLAPDTISIAWSRGGDGKWEPVAEKLANSGSFEWTVPRDMTIAGALRVSAIDKAGNVGSGESAQILVDSIAPSGRVIGPAISASLDNELQLAISDAGPSGLATAQVWVSQDDGGTWSEGPVVEAPFKSVKWPAARDGRYRLAVVARDLAGNVNPQPQGKADEQFTVLVDTTKPVILLASANGVVEAEGMKPRQKFKPGDRVAVQFEVKDAALAPNPVTVWLSTEAGKWEELAKGQPADVAYRFDVPKLAQARVQARIKLTAVDLAGNVAETIASEPFVIDSEVEAGDSGLAP